jgi:hypothetical protein
VVHKGLPALTRRWAGEGERTVAGRVPGAPDAELTVSSLRFMEGQRPWIAAHWVIDSKPFASEKAIDKAKAATEERFDRVSETRQQVGSYMTRVEVEALRANLNEKINLLTARVDGFLAVQR